jgi:hypothetical protein
MNATLTGRVATSVLTAALLLGGTAAPVTAASSDSATVIALKKAPPKTPKKSKVANKHKEAYKKKLTRFWMKMDDAQEYFDIAKEGAQSVVDGLAQLKASGAPQEAIAEQGRGAEKVKVVYQKIVGEDRDKILAELDDFRDTAVDWFPTKDGRKAYKAGMKAIRGGFEQLYTGAHEELFAALRAVMAADEKSGYGHLFAAGTDRLTSANEFTSGLKALRALQ